MEISLQSLLSPGMLILVALWTYFFIYSYRNNSSRPWGFGIVLVGVLVSGHKLTYRNNGIVVLSIDSLLIITLLGFLWNINNIQRLIRIQDFKRILSFSVIAILFGFLAGYLLLIAGGTEYIQGGADYTLFALVAGSIQKSIAEELLFRGCLLDYIKKFVENPLIAIVVQSSIFSILHMSRFSENWTLLSITFLFGFLTGYLTWKSDNIIPASIMHIIVNLFAVAWRLS